MAKNFLLQFGTGLPSLNTGLAPTFSVFRVIPGGGATTPPGITELPTTTGLFYFTYGMSAGSNAIAFVVDGFTSALGSARYIAGELDPSQFVDEQLTAQGTTLVAIGNSLTALGNSFGFGSSLLAVIGSTASSFGTTAADPATVFGFLKRLQEFNEGNSNFAKTSGVWDIYARGNAVGASTQLIQKTLTDSGSIVTKT